ncbi:isocitrate lyase/phosphoenolpyruvate mutase family protein [Methylocystis sp. IM3]|uniref:isocitrate lyase/PEP mutase family protein n=1 Tax=unclassified Methylocystis TaxID=2625913 RepID=UPI0030F5D568
MNQTKKAKYFASLHKKGAPILLYNAWDSGSAVTIQGAGAKAIATSSWSVADAQGYEDGEQIPREFVEQIVARIAATVDVPVTVDFEGGYSSDNKKLASNVARLMDLGVIGINFEDQVIGRGGLYSARRQAGRIAVIRRIADQKGLPFFINARTDVFLQGRVSHRSIREAIERSVVYGAAGASGFFIPGLTDIASIAQIAKEVQLPVNVEISDGMPSISKLVKAGVSRISHGLVPYIKAMSALEADAAKLLAR